MSYNCGNYEQQCGRCYDVCYCVPWQRSACDSVVALVTGIETSVVVPSGNTPIPENTIILPNTTVVPANTVTVLSGYTSPATTNMGGILSTNGFFTIPVSGRYSISAFITFELVQSSASTDMRALYIYRVNRAGLVTVIGVDSRFPVSGSTTSINVATLAELCAGDRIFLAVLQTSGSVPISTVANGGRLAITKIN